MVDNRWHLALPWMGRIQPGNPRVHGRHAKPGPRRQRDLLENVIVRIGGTMAFVTFDQHGPEGSAVGWGGRVLEWTDGRWRIIDNSNILEVLAPTRSAVFKVNRDAVVRRMNQPAEAMIGNGGPLRLIAGRLAAHDALETRQIRAAIEHAWDCDKAIPSPSQTRVPILLQQDSDDAVCVCWVAGLGSQNSWVQVSLNDASLAEDRIDAAAVVFGLSPTQQRLAELIASGNDVVASSGLLGITANTAKTHLQRIYDKTGARSQTALIRTLLSIERPE